MKKNTLTFKALFVMFVTLLVFSCKKNDDNGAPPPSEEEKKPTIVALAQEINVLSSFVKALKTADDGLVALLSKEGKATVFAPTNGAFNKLFVELDGFDSLDDFDTAEEKELLAKILKYHIITAKSYYSTDLSNGKLLKTLQSEDVTVNVDISIFLKDKTEEQTEIVGADKEASNGVLQIVDKVLLPQEVIDIITPKPSIVELVAETETLSILEQAILKTGLLDVLNADDPFTVFAPSNDAFVALLAELDDFNSLDDFNEPAEIALLTEILKYHVVEANVFSGDLSNRETLQTLQTEKLTVALDNEVYIHDKSEVATKVTGADNEALNGVVHIINKVLLPQAALDILFPPKPSIIELVTETAELGMLKEAMLKAGLVDTLNADGPFTVFAPTNAAIEELFNLLGDNFNSFSDFDNLVEIQILKQILLYHVIEGGISSAKLTTGVVPTLFTGESIEVIASGAGFVIGDASAIDANLLAVDKEASNGYVHMVDKILIPAQVQAFLDQLEETKDATIKELVEETTELSFLKEALELTGLLDVLGEDGPFTVFAPSNEALKGVFALVGGAVNSLDDIDTDFEIDLLREVLLYHVVSGKINASNLAVGDLETLSKGNTLEVVKTKDGYSLVDATTLLANIELTDIPAKNGVIHTVDRILIPKSILGDIRNKATVTILNYIKRLKESDQVYQLFLKVGDRFEDVLSSEFTFFLPTNKAFLDLFDALDGYNSIADFNTKEEIDILVKILKYHCVEVGKIKSNELVNDQVLATAQGESLELTIGQNIYIADKTATQAKVTASDKEILKGVIHLIDKVLLPQEIIDALN